MTTPVRLSALRITLIYILVAVIGLSLGDLLVSELLTADPAVVLWGITEDLLFTLVSAAVVYLLVWRALRTRAVLEQHYSELFANTPLGIYRTTPDGRILAANPALLHMLGYTSLAELAQRNLEREGFNPRYERNVFRTRLEHEEQIVGLEAEWQRRDDTTIYVRENARVSRDARGAIVAYDGVVEDITERRQTELALERERDVLRALLDSTVDTIYFKDTQARFTRINQAQARVLGVTDPHEALGKTDADFFPPDLAEIMLAEERQVIATGRPSLNREEYNPTHTGQPRWFSVSKNALFDQAGQIIGLVGMSRDITAVKLREREFAAIAAIAAAMQAAATRAQMLVAALEQITTLMRVEGAVIGLCDAAARAVTFEVASGVWSESRGTRIPIDDQLRAEIAHADRVQLAARWSASDLFQPINRGGRLPHLCAAPLQAQGAALGLLVVGRTQPITADEQRLFVACGDVVAGALQRAAEHEQAQRRADQLATLNLLSRALAENLSEVEVYEPLARAVTQLLPDLSTTLISLFDPATQQIRCAYGISDGQPVNLADFAPLVLNNGPQSRAIRTRQTVIANDWLTQQPTLTIITTASNQAPVAALFAPMLAKDQVIGVVQVQSYQVDRFSAEDGDLLMAIASTAAIVIENARLFDAERRQRARAEALARLAARLNAQAELPDVLQTVCDESRQALKADAASVYVHDAIRGELRIAAVAGLPDDFLARAAPIAASVYTELLTPNQPTFVFADLRTMPDLPGAAMYQDYDLVTIATAGMLRDEHLIGVLTVKSIGRVRTFTPDELALLATFANQAAVAVQNAQLLAAEREQRIFMEALRDTAAALNSTLNVDEVLDRVLDNIGRVAPHDAANIMLIDSTTGQLIGRVARCHGYDLISPELNMEVRRLRLPVMQLANLRQMVETGQPCIISNIKTYPNWIDTPSTHWQASYVGAPIHLRDSVVGFIQLDSRQVNFFPPIVAERLQFFADQAAIAIENARLFQAEREQHSLAEALRDTSGVLAGTLDLDEVLDRILSNVGHIVPNDVASLLLIEHGVTRVLRIVGNLTPERVAKVREVHLVVAETPNLQRILETQQPHFIANTDTDPSWTQVPEIDWIKSNIVAPMIVKGQIVGMLALDSRQPNFYAASHAERLQIFAAQAAVALENAQLFDAAQQRLKELAALFDGSRAMTASLDRTTVLNTITQRLCQAVDATSVYVLSVDLVASVVHMLAEYFSPAANELERVSDLGATYRLDDLPDTLEALRQGQPSITMIDDPQAESVAVKQLHTYGGQSSLRVPMNVAGKIRAYAVIWDSRSARRWTEAEIRLCQTLANQAAVALENVRL
ncbi:MAG: GAF domain-containing protein, partial [Thermoflexales bacterium]|nr:GAF domain-containing protein [Thermoflexales bacterium]